MILNLFGQRSVLLIRKCNYIFFYQDEIYLNLVLEYIPETVYKVHRTTKCFTEFEKIFGYAFAIYYKEPITQVARQYSKQKQTIPVTFIKLYMYQLFRLDFER